MRYSELLLCILVTVAVSVSSGCKRNDEIPRTLAKGSAALQQREYGNAAKLLASAVEKHPKNAQAHYLLGITRCRLEDWQGSLEPLGKAAKLWIDDPSPLEFMAHSYGELEEWNKAVNTLKKAYERDPASARILTALAAAEINSRKIASARKNLMKALELDPEYPPAVFNYAFLNHRWTDQQKVAKTYMEQFLELSEDPGHSADARKALAAIKKEAQRPVRKPVVKKKPKPAPRPVPKPVPAPSAPAVQPAARAVPQTAVARARNRKLAVAETRLGSELSRNKQWDEAIEHLTLAIDADDSYDIAHYNLGLTHQAAGSLDKAIASFKNTLRLKPSKTDARYALAYTLWKKRDTPKAIATLKQLLNLTPEHAAGHFLLGLIHEKRTGGTETTRQHYLRYLRLQPSGSRARHAQSWLEANAERTPVTVTPAPGA